MKTILGVFGPWEILIILTILIMLTSIILHKKHKSMSFCPKCGAQVADGTTFCPNCGYKLSEAQPVSTPSQPQPQPQPTTPNHKPCPDNYLVYAILTTLFCCLPFGIVGIVKASQVSSKYQAGDYEGAVQASADAKKWSQIALICGIVWVALYFIIVVVAGVSLY